MVDRVKKVTEESSMKEVEAVHAMGSAHVEKAELIK